MKYEIKYRDNDEVLFSDEAESFKDVVKLAVENKIDLSYADLSYSNLRSMNFRSANLRYANLRYADLSYADLRSVNLSYANLRYSNLNSVDFRSADLSYSDLCSADLRYANLSYTNLSYAYFSNTTMFGEKINKIPLQISGLDWLILITEKHIQIGCETYKAEEWFSFDNDKISNMHSDALSFWNKNKKLIKTAWENHKGE